MLENTQFIIEAGRLQRVLRPMHKRPWLMLFFFLFSLGLGIAGTVFVFQEQILPKEDAITLTQKAYDELIQIRNNQEVSNELLARALERSVTPEQLALVFDTIFADVRLSPAKREAYLSSISKWSTYYAMPPLLVLSMIWRESTFNEKTVSSANARGPMQVIYRHHKEKLDRLGKGEQDLHTIDVGVHVGVEILREYFKRYDRNIFRALTAYVGGQHSTYAQDIMTRYFKSRIFLDEYVQTTNAERSSPTGATATKLLPVVPAKALSKKPAPKAVEKAPLKPATLHPAGLS